MRAAQYNIRLLTVKSYWTEKRPSHSLPGRAHERLEFSRSKAHPRKEVWSAPGGPYIRFALSSVRELSVVQAISATTNTALLAVVAGHHCVA